MLVMRRRAGESILIGEDIEILRSVAALRNLLDRLIEGPMGGEK